MLTMVMKAHCRKPPVRLTHFLHFQAKPGGPQESKTLTSAFRASPDEQGNEVASAKQNTCLLLAKQLTAPINGRTATALDISRMVITYLPAHRSRTLPRPVYAAFSHAIGPKRLQV